MMKKIFFIVGLVLVFIGCAKKEPEVVFDTAQNKEVVEVKPLKDEIVQEEPHKKNQEEEDIEPIEDKILPEKEDSNTTIQDLDTNATEPQIPQMQTKKAEIKVQEVEIPKIIKKFKPLKKRLGVLRVTINKESLDIFIKDAIIRKDYLKNPNRIVIDFKPLRYFKTKSITINSPLISKINTASHEKFNRVVIYTKKDIKFDIKKEKKGWKINFSTKVEQ